MSGANEVEVVVKSTDDSKHGFQSAEKNADKLGEALKKAGKVADDSLKGIGKVAKPAADALKQAGEEADKTGKKFKGAGEDGKKAGDQIKDGLGGKAKGGADALSGRLGPLSGALGKLAPLGAAAGTAIAAGMAVATAAIAGATAALKASVERSQVGAMIGAQGGGTDPGRMAELGKLAGKVYSDNFGESLAAAGTAVRDVLRNHLLPEDATDELVKKTSEKLLTIGTVVEADSSEVARSVKTLLNTGLVKSADEAFDLIARGSQQGLNVAGDLLDTLTEYPTQFRKLGLSAETSLGLLQQGLRGGARDTDIVADALKEFSIRAVDGSKLTAQGFKAIGLDAKKMADDVAAGGPRAAAALQLTLDKLRAIKDPAKQAQAAVSLFGTQAEDLGKALYSLDPSKAVGALGDVQGAADAAAKALGGGLGNELETVQRKFGQMLADIGDQITPAVQAWIDNFTAFGDNLKTIFSSSAVPGELLNSLKDIAEKYGPAVQSAFHSITEAVAANRPELEQLGHFIAGTLIPLLGGALILGIEAVGGAFANLIRVVGFVVDAFNWLKKQGEIAVLALAQIFVGALFTIAETAAAALGWIPGIGDKLREARDRVGALVGQINDKIAGLDKKKDIEVNVYYNYHTRGQSLNAPLRTGGIPHAAAGGAQDGLTVINEDGQEAVRLPTGSIVYPHANANQMRSGGGGGAIVTRVEFGGNLDSGLAEWFMKMQRGGKIKIYSKSIVEA